MIVKTKLVRLLKASAITVFPFIFVDPYYLDYPALYDIEKLLLHESIHIEQQKKWAIYGLGIGLLVWWALYLLALPVGWNSFRKKWETEAYLAEGYSQTTIDTILKRAPYYLWWM